MKKIATLIVGVTLLVSPLLCQKQETRQEAYSGTAIRTSALGQVNIFGFPG
jgi:hypothetical protein